MSLSEALKEKKLDVRLRDKLFAQGRLTAEELTKYQSTLTDDSTKMSVIKSPERRKKQDKSN